MTMRRRLAQLNDLQQLQRVERDLASLDHAEACTHADMARGASDRATEWATALGEQWYAGRALGRFEPELDALTAAGLIAAERRALTEAAAAAVAETERENRAGAWRLTDARQRATTRIVRDARRAIMRADDEARLDLAAARALDRSMRS
jgi:hypothetical protein